MYNRSPRPFGSSSQRFSRRPNQRKFTGKYISIDRFIQKASMTTPVEVYVPKHNFADFSLNKILKANILGKGYSTPTAIQDRTIPVSLEGRDVIGIANTGTGKTAAFLIPLIHKVSNHKYDRVLIMTPTRELALQIQQEFKEFARGMNQYATLVIGGAPIGAQIAQLRRNPQFVIGTPGRLKDLVERRVLNLSGFRSVVLDEADRMLDMGFIDDIQLLLSGLSEERQTLFFSATMSPQIQALTRNFLKDPVMISVKSQDTSANVDQDVIHVNHEDDRIEQLHELLVQPSYNKVLIFGQTKYGVESLSNELADRGFRVACIHGDKTQPKRQRALNMFKQEDVQILVATDVAARGLDIPNVSHVINYDIPSTYEDYVHRIGRTGRANNKGYALTFVTAHAQPSHNRYSR
ncbi:MAG TPA: DEAD/DEAH box helicase [Patescibacteria group bacterium]